MGAGITPDLARAVEVFAAEKMLPMGFTPQAVAPAAVEELPEAGTFGPENFIGAFVGEKRVSGAPTGQTVLKVLVRRKVDDPSRIDPQALIGETFQGQPVDIEELEEVFLLNFWGFEPPPAKGGASIGHGPSGATGTLGCLVAEEGTNYLCILSNNHVIGNSNMGQPGDKIFHPGRVDQGLHVYQIGTLYKIHPISFTTFNEVDAALARTRPEVADFAHHFYTLNPELQTARVGMLVSKEGRTTGPTLGVVRGVLGVLDVPYPVKTPFGVQERPARFREQIVIQGLGGAFSQRGDSGSLVVEHETKRPVGLLFAGGRGRDGIDYTFANPIRRVREALNINRFISTQEPVLNA
ncbi:MAG TPA: hypothetical protein VIL46_12065 [Gemmataceae bacterium]